MPGVVALTDEEREALVEQVLAGMAQGKPTIKSSDR